MKYESILHDLEKINSNLKNLEFISYAFLYGSCSRMLIHEESDIDLLLIGEAQKNIKIVSCISKFFEELELENEIDMKYYNIDEFCHLKNSNLFLNKIRKDFKSMETMYKYTEEYDTIVVSCQQYIEKALKHLYELKLNELSKSHKLIFLAKQLDIPEILKYSNELRIIQDYYFDKRYPSESYMETTKEECDQAVEITTEIKAIVEAEVDKYNQLLARSDVNDIKQCDAFDFVDKESKQ